MSDLFKTLDDRWKAAMTPQQKRQSVSRRNGLPSLRSPKLWSSPAVSLGCTIFVDHSAIVLGAVMLLRVSCKRYASCLKSTLSGCTQELNELKDFLLNKVFEVLETESCSYNRINQAHSFCILPFK